MRAGVKWTGLLLAVLLLFTCWPPAVAAEITETGRVVRVAYPLQRGFTEKDLNGNYSGYTYEYLEEISQYTGWNYEYVELPGDLNEQIAAGMEMVKNGELDLLGGVVYNDALAEQYDYVSQSYGMVYSTLMVPANDANINGGDVESMQGMRVAVNEHANSRLDELTNYCKANDIRFEPVYCEPSETRTALFSGKADAVLDNDAVNMEGLRIIARFSPQNFYFVTTKGNADIVREANQAILSIDEADPYFATKLHEKYFGFFSGDEVAYSNKELAYMDQTTVLRVGFLTDRAPIQYQDEKTGEPRGISIDLLNEISRQTGLQFELVPVDSEDELRDKIHNHELDLIAGMDYDYIQAKDLKVSMTRPYLDTQYMLLLGSGVEEESVAGKRLAVAQYWSDHYDGPYVGQVQWYKTIAECVEAVQSGQADYTYVDGYMAQYYVNQPRYRSLRMIPLGAFRSHQVCIGLVRPCEPELLTVLNKQLLNLPAESMQSLVFKNVNYQQDYTLRSFVDANPSTAVASVAGLAAFVIAILLWALRNQLRLDRQTALNLKKHYQLYALSNEHYFEFDMENRLLSVSFPQDERDGGEPIVKEYRQGEVLPPELGEDSELLDRFIVLLPKCKDGVNDLGYDRGDGSQQWVRVTARTVRDDAGKPVYIIGKFSSIEEEMREKEALMNQAQRDGLTKLFNTAVSRRRISDYLTALKSGEQGALLIVDIDRFKEINDHYGHLTGDKVLRGLADILQNFFREGDVVGRLGGDEFVVYMERVRDRNMLRERCQTLENQISRLAVEGLDQEVTVSIGVTLTKAGEPFDVLYRRADTALYTAKRNGRGRFEII